MPFPRLPRRAWLQLGLVTASGLVFPAVAQSPGGSLTRRATALLARLDDPALVRILLAVTDRWRDDWHYTPRRRPGLTLGEMDDGQRGALWALLEVALSQQGLVKAKEVIETEAILADITGNRRFRDPDNYALVFFGDPRRGPSWTMRFEGHHLSLTFGVVDDVLVDFSPAFYGANPAVAPPRHPKAGFQALEAERSLGFELINRLAPELRDRAILAERSLGNIVAGPGREDALRQRQGVAVGALDPTNRELARQLLGVYLDNAQAPWVQRQRDAIAQVGFDNFYFAWAGSRTPDAPHYYRLHGPGLLIEYDNTQNGANHIHSVLHQLRQGAFDPLAAHYHRDHGVGDTRGRRHG
ncbi:MAG: DUF3500 domain-containing protein [Candidatus Competibacterales bacterium]